MSIITPQDFKGENRIAQVEALPAVQQSVQWFIDKYEPKFLDSLLGKALSLEFLTGLKVLPTTDIAPKWTALKNNASLKEMLICYVYYWYQRSATTHTAGISEVKAKAENSTAVNSVDKQVRSWNEMVEMTREFDLDITAYPSYVKPEWRYRGSWHGHFHHKINEIFFPVNSRNI